MKKLVLFLAILLVVPATAFGIQYDTMNNTRMDEVTGQAGVQIALDDIQIFMNIDRIAWLDCDGFVCCDDTNVGGDGGALGISNFQLDVLQVNAVDTAVAKSGGVWDLTNANPCSQIGLVYNYGDTTSTGTCQLAITANTGTQTLGLNNYTSTGDSLGSDRFIPSPLIIDATSQLPILTQMRGSSLNTSGEAANTGGVLICLPTIEIDIPVLALTPAFYNIDGEATAYNALDDAHPNCNFGTVVLDGITMTVLSGWIEIAPTCQ